MSRSYKRDRDGHYQFVDFAARLNRTKYSETPTPNRRNQRRDSSEFSPVRRKGVGPDVYDKTDSVEAYNQLDHTDTGFQMTGGRTRGMHFMPPWEPVRVHTGLRIAWLPKHSEYVTLKERQLAKIAVLLEAGQDPPKISRRLGIPLRTLERRIAYLLSMQPDAGRSGGQTTKTRAKVEEKTPPTYLKGHNMPAKKSKITPFEPITIELTVRQRADGRIVFGYAGDDDRTPVLGEFILDTICGALDAV
jgi:hypothetical protein